MSAGSKEKAHQEALFQAVSSLLELIFWPLQGFSVLHSDLEELGKARGVDNFVL